MKRALLVFLVAVTVFSFAPHVLAADEKPSGTTIEGMCWSEAQCLDNNSSNKYVEDTSHCGKLAGTPRGYCYPPLISYSLIIPLGDVKSVKGLGGYVQALYALAIMLATVGSVLTIMIAGLRWMMARGDAGAVSAAKQMVSKGIVTVIILLGVVTLANLIDPTLTLLNPFRTPLVRQVNFLPEGSSCEEMAMAPYNIVISPKSGKCGDKGKVEKIPDQEGSIILAGVKEGDECVFGGCNAQNLESCVSIAGQYKCLRCGNADDLTDYDFTPSPSSCSGLKLNPAFGTLPDGTKSICGYYNSSWYSPGTPDSCVEIVYPWSSSSPGLDCNRLKADYGGLGCGAYDYVAARAQHIKGSYLGIPWVGGGYLSSFHGQSGQYELFRNVCENDLCEIAAGCRVNIDAGYVYDTVTCAP